MGKRAAGRASKTVCRSVIVVVGLVSHEGEDISTFPLFILTIIFILEP